MHDLTNDEGRGEFIIPTVLMCVNIQVETGCDVSWSTLEEGSDETIFFLSSFLSFRVAELLA